MITPAVRIARSGWPLVAGASLALSLAALTAMPGYYRSQPKTLPQPGNGAFHLSPGAVAAIFMVLTMLPAAVFFIVALIVRYRSVPDSMSLICSYVLVLFACGVVGPVPWIVYGNATLWGSPALTAVGRLSTPVGIYAFCVFFCVFPSGHFVPRWARWPALAAAAGLVAGLALAATGHPGAGADVFQTIGLGFLVLDLAAQVYRYRRVSPPAQRQQTKWVLLGLAAALAVVGANQLVSGFLPRRISGSQLAQNLDGAITWQVAFMLIGVGIGVAVLRYRLWDVDLVINRALLYAALTVAVVVTYVLVVGYLGRALRTQTSLWMSLVATGVVAVVIQPLRGLLQQGVNRLTYGQRDEPYEVVTEIGRRLATSVDHQPLASAVQTLATALKLNYVAIAVHRGGSTVIAAEHGQAAADPVILPLEYQSAEVGQLLVGRRRGGPLTPRDTKLLRNLARQIGPAVHAATLTDNLQRSRMRLVTAREEERRRLRRDLHDGLGPALAGLALKAGAVADMIPLDPGSAQHTARNLYGEIRSTIGDVRRLVYGLRPPSLDELGLAGAIQEMARRHRHAGGPDITVVIDGDLSSLPAAVEVAAYRITDELLTNVGRHASARACTVRVSRRDMLEVTVTDDGVGVAADAAPGVGRVAIQERATELGGTVALGPGPEGGTRVTVRIPVPAGKPRPGPGQAERSQQAGESPAWQEASVDAAAGADR
jgi:signal transduction histidine kinase